jgi:pimeloyl-ACP methyl ester carboxylesterase
MGQTGWIDFLVSRGHTVVGLDIRGHGESGKPREPGAYDLQLMAEDVLAVMDATGVEQADLVGYSIGDGSPWTCWYTRRKASNP